MWNCLIGALRRCEGTICLGIAWGWMALLASAQPMEPPPPTKANTVAVPSGGAIPGTTPIELPLVPKEASSTVSEAEQITRLQRTIAGDEKRVEDLRCEVADPQSEYQKAEAEFRAIEDRFTRERADLEKSLTDQPVEVVDRLRASLVDTEKTWKLARARFDLAIQTRKTQQEQIAVLEAKVKQDKAALDKLTGVEPKPAPTEAPAEAPKPATPAPMETPAPVASNAQPAAPALATSPAAIEAAVSASPRTETEKARSQELIAAKQTVDVKQQAAQEAEAEARNVTERLEALNKSIAIEQKLLAAARQKSDLANQSRLSSEQEYRTKSAEGLTGNELAEIAARRSEAEQLFQESRNEVRRRTDRLEELQGERAELQQQELAALQQAKERQDEAEIAEAALGELKNPYSIRNLSQWSLNHGPTLLLYLGIMYSLYKIMQLFTRRAVELMVQSSSRSPPEENEARVNTLVGVFQNAATMTIIIGGGIMICEEAGIAVAPLMGGAAVLGLAVAFGAQNLIRDYFYGFVILLENQYKINDVLKIGDVSGQVERITLRMTVLRDLEGCVHFIPNGKIDCVTNMTHGWSRAVFDIGIAHKEDADRVMDLLLTLATDLRRESAYARLIIDDPEMLGVDKLDSTGVTIKFLIKTRPLKQWTVQRELLRRIKRRFRELEIETSMPPLLLVRKDAQSHEHVMENESHSSKRKVA